MIEAHRVRETSARRLDRIVALAPLARAKPVESCEQHASRASE
ncbi:MAG TPA: hypothetical protein VF331_22210 [Polyangiales bacterium]